MKGFLQFVREQGVVGLAVGFLLGGSVSKVVTSLVNDIINPLVGVLISRVGELKDWKIPVYSQSIYIGNFVSVLIDFTIIAFVVYFGIKGLKLDKIDRKKEKEEDKEKEKDTKEENKKVKK